MNRLLLIVISFAVSQAAFGQFTSSTSGLMQMPTAEMEASGTFVITNNYLNWHNLHPHYWSSYNTFSYGFSLTVFSRVEIAYICTIIDGKKKDNPSARDLIMYNQDRHFAAKVQLLKEGDFLDWMPALAVGACDPLSSSEGDYREQSIEGSGSGVFNRYYVAMTKHFETKIGRVGTHVGYQFNKRRILGYNSPAVAIDWSPIWTVDLWGGMINNVDVIAEYDGRSFNVGCIASVWRRHFDVMLELSAMKYFQAGIRYRIVLKS